jgi:hypothetical protein
VTDLLWEETVCPDTWQGAREFLNELKDRYVFRGMSSAAWDLETSLDRIRGYRYAESEEILIASFRRAVLPPIHGRPPDEDCVSWLALMRHYGLPSRLLDCTKSPFVAAYFAAEPPPDTDSGSDFAIWAINEDALQRSAEARLGILSQCSAPLSPPELGTDTLFSAALRHPMRFVALVDANHKSDRQRAQQGLFLCPGDPGWPFWRNLQGIPREQRTQGFMYKVVLPCGARRAVLADLSGMDLDHMHLLPALGDTEELCTTLKERLEDSQKHRGHFEWKVAVKPILKKYGLLEAELAYRRTR